MEDLKALRKEIDALDEQLVKVFVERLSVCERIGEFKRMNGMPVVDQAREEEIYAKLEKGLDEKTYGFVKSLYKRIFTLCAACQKK